MAQKWLGKNNNIRKLKDPLVKRYAACMVAGDWDSNGESIKFNTDGELIDGQHRLTAIARCGESIRMVVVSGVKDDTYIDDGGKRSLGDYMVRAGFKNVNVLIAASRLIIASNAGAWGTAQARNWQVSRRDHMLFCQENKECLDAAVSMSRPGQCAGIGGNSSILAAVLYLGSKNNNPAESSMAEWFSSRLIDGEDVTKTDAVWHARNTLIRNRNSKSTRLSPNFHRALLAVSWNKTLTGDECRSLRVSLSGPNAVKKIPEVIQES